MNRATRRNFLKHALIGSGGFAAGYAAHYFLGGQSLEKIIKGEEWRNVKSINKADLQGLDQDDKVLEEARGSIIQHRKAAFELLITAPDGSPMPEQAVQLKQKSNEVEWGCSGAGSFALLQQDPLHRKRSEHFAQLFDSTTAKCYWDERWHQPIEQKEGLRIYDRFLDEVAWGKALGLRVKGHPLVWTVPKAIPDWLLKYDYGERLDILKSHVQSLVEVGGDDVALWDLCNEMLWEPAFKNIEQRKWPHLDPIEDIAEYIAMSLRWAREVNPKAVYALNDYGLVYTYRDDISAGEQRQRYLKILEALKKRGIVPDAVGCQSHIGGKFQLGAFRRALDELSQAGLPVQVTEYWSKEKDFGGLVAPEEIEQALTDYVCDCYTVAYAQPSLSHFTYWGGRQFFDEQGKPSLLYRQLHDLIRNQWATRYEGRTDAEGKLTFSGFKGKYELTLPSNPQKTIALDLYEGGAQTMRLPE